MKWINSIFIHLFFCVLIGIDKLFEKIAFELDKIYKDSSSPTISKTNTVSNENTIKLKNILEDPDK